MDYSLIFHFPLFTDEKCPLFIIVHNLDSTSLKNYLSHFDAKNDVLVRNWGTTTNIVITTMECIISTTSMDKTREKEHF